MMRIRTCAMIHPMNIRLLLLESVLLYAMPPLLILSGALPKYTVMPMLWAALVYVLFILRRSDPAVLRFHIDPQMLRHILLRFALLATLMVLFVICCYPKMLFSLPMHHPGFWLLVMLLYPPLSALAQEVVFRAFFAYRYEKLIPQRALFMLSNALVFAYVHSLYANPVAVSFSFAGALLFMSTYLKTRSVAMSTVEHALYGNLIFTLGLGHFFYHAG
jgi:uncharacterized protein